MANLDDLDYKSILNMNNDEAIDLLRQIRLSRRTSNTKPKPQTVQRKEAAKKVDVSSDMAAELLKILGGSK